MAEFTSTGKGNAALTTGIIGTAGFGATLLGNMLGGGLFGNNNVCNEDHFITRYDAQQMHTINNLGNENAMLKAENETNKKIAEVFERTAIRIRALEDKVNENTCGQAVINQQVGDNIKFVDSKFDGVYKAIAEGDARVKCYADCHFVPGKLIMPLDSVCPPAMPLCPEPAAKSAK